MPSPVDREGSPPDPAPARRLGKYEVIARIGKGGMAEVHLARMHGPMNFRKLVVVKTILPDVSQSPGFLEMLLDEARLAALIKHPRVVDIYELGQESDTYFIAMEYLDGQPLSVVMTAGAKGHPMDPFSVARIIADAAEGLHAAHELKSMSGRPLGLVHRDVSPGNIMVLYDGTVKIVDFGVAKARGRLTTSGVRQLKGKVGYVSPEQLAAQPVDRRSDVYSLGVVFWEALTFRRLFRGESFSSLAEQMSGPLVSPSVHRPQVPPPLDAICLRALSYDPEDRYQTAGEMRDDLERVLIEAGRHRENDVIARYMGRWFSQARAQRHLLIRRAAGTTGEVAIVDAAPPVTRTRETNSPVPTPAAAATDARRRRWPVFALIALLTIIAGGMALIYAEQRSEQSESPSTARETVGRKAPQRVAATRSADRADDEVTPGGEASATAPGEATPAADARPAAENPATGEPAPAVPGPAGDDEPGAGEATSPATGKPRAGHTASASSARPAVTKSAATLYTEGADHFVRGAHAQAKESFQRALDVNPRYAPAHRGLGLVYQAQGRTAKAIAAYEKYLRLAPGATDAAAIRQRIDDLKR